MSTLRKTRTPLLLALAVGGAMAGLAVPGIAVADDPDAGPPQDTLVRVVCAPGDPGAGEADGTEVQRAPAPCPADLPAPSAEDVARFQELTACLREHGVELPAPGTQAAVVAAGEGVVGDALDRAHEACWPAGGGAVRVEGGA